MGVAEHPVGVLTELAGGRSREGGVEGIDLGQQADIGQRVATGERLERRATAVTDGPGGVAVAPRRAELDDELGNLGP